MLISADDLSDRKRVVAGPLGPLAASLAADLDRLLPADQDVFVPPEKARMTRAGGRCARDGSFLEFDPRSPHRHRCPQCRSEYEGDAHYRWWIMGYQLWLAERVVHASVLWSLTADRRRRSWAAKVLEKLADQYLRYPNEDNVLGPTRVFFSTYLESIWTLQLAVAVSLLDDDEPALGATVRDRILEPSSRLIASFDEHQSNRQVWNDAALAAVGVLLDRRAMLDDAMYGRSGFEQFLRSGLLSDGSWYEGENYHLFAHRGLWYLATIGSVAGLRVPVDLEARFDAGFVAPLKTALPDFTFPARRDSQYRASLRQWRIAESLELGLARSSQSEELASGVASVYADTPPGDVGRWRSTAEAERNLPAARLTRADLGWKSLLVALPELPGGGVVPARSALMEGQGFAVIRRDAGRVYSALDYGHSGGSHGHPDRLNLWLVDGDRRVLEDVGTGSYVERTLHWYRSTLAHNAPLIDGKSQEAVEGTLLAWDEQGDWSWVNAEAEIASGVLARRSVVVGADYLVDRVEWTADRDVTLDLPIHVDGEIDRARWSAGTLTGGSGLEDGFEFLRDVEVADAPNPARIASSVTASVYASVPVEWWRAVAPGPPGQPPRRFLLTRARNRNGVLTSIWSWRGDVSMTVEADGAVLVSGRTPAIHRLRDGRWHVQSGVDNVVLDGRRVRAPRSATNRAERVIEPVSIPRVEPALLGELTERNRGRRFELGEAHYRRTEADWKEAGSPTATVVIAATSSELLIEVTVGGREHNFSPAREDNDLDNEHPDTNSDGLQLYLATNDGRTASWLLVPEGRSYVRMHRRNADDTALSAQWRSIDGGWQLLARLDRSALGNAVALDVIVNEMPAGRERRRGQLVLSGGGGWAYLRGDRQDGDRLLPFVLPS